MKLSLTAPRIAAIVVLVAIGTIAGNFYLTKLNAGRKADRESATFMQDFSPAECRDRTHITTYRTLYRNVQVNHALTDSEVTTALSLLVGPNQEQEEMRTFFGGLFIDAGRGPNPALTPKQMTRIATTCKPLLHDKAPALRQTACIFLYRSKLPEAEASILPLTQDPEEHVRKVATKYLNKIAHDRATNGVPSAHAQG